VKITWCECGHTKENAHAKRKKVDRKYTRPCQVMICDCKNFSPGEVNPSGERNLGVASRLYRY
jgi:hypothetical protein